MVVTQPRRISAISVAERIAQERTETVGQTAGYHIRLEAKKSAKTKLLLMTTGVLLRRLQIEQDLQGISHVFVDEVHERDINTDFMLVVLKTLMRERSDLKVILMSATLNADVFSKYFAEFSCQLITIPGRAFPVTTFFLEDVLQQTKYRISPSSDCVFNIRNAGSDDPIKRKHIMTERNRRWALLQQSLGNNCSAETMKSLEIVDESILNKDLVRTLIVHIATTCEAGGNIYLFTYRFVFPLFPYLFISISLSLSLFLTFCFSLSILL